MTVWLSGGVSAIGVLGMSRETGTITSSRDSWSNLPYLILVEYLILLREPCKSCYLQGEILA